jgi:hypothetical protein
MKKLSLLLVVVILSSVIIGSVMADGIAITSSGMRASVYDPTAVKGDAFDMDNMAEGTTTKILTNTERAEISANTSAKHTQGTDTALGAVGTKDPPIDADKAIYRDSTDSDSLVTSTWTQIKAFLKTYFDTLYTAKGASFSAFQSSTVAEATGAGTAYDVIFDTEVYDTGGGYAHGTGIFTAPDTGKYLLTAIVKLGSMTVNHNRMIMEIITSNRTYGKDLSFGAGASPYNSQAFLEITVIADMEANDTAKVTVTVLGGSGTIGVVGAAAPTTYFSGTFIK